MAISDYQRRKYKDAKPAYDALMKVYPFTLENLEGEEWSDVAGHKGLYQVSTFGRVKSLQRKKRKIMRPQIAGQGYLTIGLHENNKCTFVAIHRLVAQAFIPNPECKPQVDHINGQPFNNHVSNLRWATSLENNHHAVELGFKQSGEDNTRAVLTNAQVEWCRKFYKPRNKEYSIVALAKKLGVSRHVVYFAIHGHTYKNATGDYYNGDSKILRPDVRHQIKLEYKRGVKGFGYVSLAKKYGVAHTTIKKIVHEK